MDTTTDSYPDQERHAFLREYATNQEINNHKYSLKSVTFLRDGIYE